MATDSRNVLLPMHLPTTKVCREAVAKITRRTQADSDLIDEQYAFSIGVTVGTVRNARNENTSISIQTLAAIGMQYGGEALDPWARIFGCRIVPLEPQNSDADILPKISGLTHKLAWAFNDKKHLDHRDLAGMVGDLRAAQQCITNLISRADALGIVA